MTLLHLILVPRPRPTVDGGPVTRSPTVPTARSSRTSPGSALRRRWVRPPFAGVLVGATAGVASLLGLLWLLPLGSERSEPADPVPAATPATEALPPAVIAADGDEPHDNVAGPDIRLPPPFGNAPRDRPLQTVWLITPEARSLAGEVIVTEGALVIDYMATYGIIGDGLALSTDPLRRISVAAPELTAALATPGPAATSPTEALLTAVDQLAPYRDDHVSVIAITADASSWQRELDRTFVTGADPESGATGPMTRDRSSATRSTHVFELRPGSATDGIRAADDLSSITIVDPATPGELAFGLARAWVESYGGGWDPELTGYAPRRMP